MDDDPDGGDEGDSHDSIDAFIRATQASVLWDPGPSDDPIYEFQPIEFSWRLDYAFEACDESTAGTSGELVCNYKLTDEAGDELWSGSESFDLRMGDGEVRRVIFEDGVEVPDSSPGGEATFFFEVRVEPSDRQECNGDETNNVGIVQFNVLDCPCDGLRSREVFPSGLAFDEDTRELTWSVGYTAVLCGSELPERETGALTERITVASIGSDTTFDESRSVDSIALGTSVSRSITIPEEALEAEPPVSISVEILSIGGDVDCEATQPKTVTIIAGL